MGTMTSLDDWTPMRKGKYLGTFDADDKILVVYRDGNYEITDQELTQKLDSEKVIFIEKFNPRKSFQQCMPIWKQNSSRQNVSRLRQLHWKINSSSLRKAMEIMWSRNDNGWTRTGRAAGEEGAQVRKGQVEDCKNCGNHKL